VAISLINITEIRQRERLLADAQQKAMLSDRAKSEFLANMSHEIRTPMNGVLGMAELLAKTSLDTKQRTFTDIIVKSGNALLTIINDILDFSKIDAGQMVLDPAPFDIAEAVEDVATLVSTRAKEKDLELIVRIDPAMPRSFIGDVGRIRQIITNLMGNAVKFTERGHVLIDITGRETGDSWQLHCRVVDTGIGIPEDKLALVFEKFSQVDSSSTRRHEGTGLGLAITSKLVELMKGKVGAESKLGAGSTFWFTVNLPVHEGSVRRVPVAPAEVAGARVLIIDDNPVNCAILLEQFKAWNFDACAAESGKIGLAVLEAAAKIGLPVDLVILDYQMPDMNGGEVLAAIRSNSAIANVPVTMLTSVDQALSSDMLKAYDVDQHLLKPARSAQLLEAIAGGVIRGRIKRGQPLSPSKAGPVRPDPEAVPVFADAPPTNVDPVRAPAPVASPVWKPAHLDVLVAEDNEVNQLVYTQILSDLPYTFEIVSNGRLAVEAFRDQRPSLILMDVSMPEMNGLEATAAIRKLEGGSVPIVGVTAHALKGDQERCLAAGMNDYLSKPISPDTLAGKIRHWIEHARQKAAVS
jgi:CheY-like chemotaxis protein/nitrogen-specific signal transduction histidine kinase